MSKRYAAVGMVEFRSITAGIDGSDQMVKAAQVDPLFFKTICPGKFVAAVTGDVAAVSAAVAAGRGKCPQEVVDWFVIANIHRDVVQALAGRARRWGYSKRFPPYPSWLPLMLR